jgi:transmembrane sensor
MDSDNTYFISLINRYMTGEATEKEISELSEWILKDSGNKKLFAEHKKIHDAVAQEMIESKIDLDAEWSAIQKRIASQQGQTVAFAPEKKNLMHIIWRVAAGLAILLSVGFLIKMLFFDKPDTIEVLASKDVLETTLPDGSTISLNKGSSISYPEEFSENIRLVELNGEAHFDVAHNPDKPFIVSAGDLRVEVLGTKFYINTNAPGEKVQVILIEGSVAAYYKDTPRDKTILKPGEEAEFMPATKKISTTTQYEKYFMVWKTRNMNFENEKLDQVINTISRAYNQKITLVNPATGNCRLTAAFETQTLESVLKVLESTLDLKVTKRGNEILVDGKACE